MANIGAFIAADKDVIDYLSTTTFSNVWQITDDS
jgi:hypothetical protein